jgi:hypothetical protein
VTAAAVEQAHPDTKRQREEYLRELIAQAPPLTAEQRDRLLSILRPARRAA